MRFDCEARSCQLEAAFANGLSFVIGYCRFGRGQRSAIRCELEVILVVVVQCESRVITLAALRASSCEESQAHSVVGEV